jgi:hypothetical protein
LDREVDVLRIALAVLRDRLPDGWDVSDAEPRSATKGGSPGGLPAGWRPDAVLEVTSPSGDVVTLVVEAKRLLAVRDVRGVLDRLDAYRRGLDRATVPMVVARYLPESVRQRLREDGASYVDATGNLLLTADRPGLFLRDRGADNDPWRGRGRPRGTLRGVPAARVVRALADYVAPMSVRQLTTRASASTGATYRVVEFLEDEALLERDPSGQIIVVAWRRLLERWSQDYTFAAAPGTGVRGYLAPRGLSALEQTLAADRTTRYALTGSIAAQRWASYAPARLAMVYVGDPERAAAAWGLRPTDAGANVALAVPDSEVVYDRSVTLERLTLAAPSQVAVDLLTGPGRSPAEATYLLDWMETNEPAWRR